MTPAEIEHLFTRGDGDYLCARWGRPIVPAVFGTDDATLAVVKGAIEAMVVLADHKMADTDPELGANLLMFYFRDWSELEGVPGLDELVDGLAPLVEKVQAGGANQSRLFRFDEAGAIKACISFAQMDGELSAMPAEILALSQASQMILTWSSWAFSTQSALVREGRDLILRPEIAAVVRAAYDPVLPAASRDPAHAMRIAARVPKA